MHSELLMNDDFPFADTDSSMQRTTVDTLIVSDIHLGSEVSRSRELLDMLRTYSFHRLILNGDVFDDLNFKRLTKSDWKFLSVIRKLSNPKRRCEVVWVAGNHDGVADILSHLLGVPVYEEYIWEENGERYMAIHGHQFDTFITRNVITTAVASQLYLWLQKAGGERQILSRWVKRTSKSWLRLSEKIAREALAYAHSKGVRHIFCGHTHIPMHLTDGLTHYYNSGCWTDRPSQYITIQKTGCEIREYV